jgi:hypothetical protein
MVSALEQGKKVVVENDRKQVSNTQADGDRYVDSRIERYLSSHRAESSTHEVLPDALHEALGQILEERRQWRRERELIQSEAQRVIADLRATISELAGEIRQKAMNIKPNAPGVAGPPGLRDHPANCRS